MMSSRSTFLVLMIGLLTTVLLACSAAGGIHIAAMAIAIAVALVYLALKTEGEVGRSERHELERLRSAYDQLDGQAKLIIRTDLELHHTQEALDRRIASLMSLHRLGRELNVTLRPEEVFSKLDGATVMNFGFSKGLLGMCPTPGQLQWRSLVRVSEASAGDLTAHLLASGLLQRILADPQPAFLQESTVTQPSQRTLLRLLGAPAAVIARVPSHTGPAGCLILGREEGGSPTDPKADAEIVSILTNHLAIALENSVLYETTWSAQQELERKVQQRTRELAEANDALTHLNKSKSDFVSAVSHELRTPLAAIKGYASLLANGHFGALAPPQVERLAKIERNVDGLTQLINNLLDIARIESGRIAMEQAAIPLPEFLSMVGDLVQPQMEAKRLRFLTDVDGVTQLIGDAPHLERVFVNLLSNAIKYTPEAGTIRLDLKQQEGSIVASVTDTGCGIAPEEIGKLFHEFYRANDPINRDVRGTGLGLALVKRIIEAHHGRIWVTSEKGQGSTFSISLPAEGVRS